jgi:hypothetical protein
VRSLADPGKTGINHILANKKEHLEFVRYSDLTPTAT